MPEVTVIPATKAFHSKLPNNTKIIRKVAAYARVSTDSEEQLTSYEAQVDYYTKYIRSNPDWQFVEVYTDEGISATNTKHRSGFNRMINDALDGKIDLIVTKSVSRFARNTVDSLTAVRKLKECGTEVFFEKENIYTFDSKGELLITIMSSLAQEESRSISENVTWGQRKRFADGKVSLPYKSFLGYKKGKDGLPEIVPEEAETVRIIYRLFIGGRTVNYIANHLTKQGILTPRGKNKWQSSTVESILTNEKYKGSAILQKKFTVDFLTKKMKVNEGEVPQYYVEHSHPAIIAPEEWEAVQKEMKLRKSNGSHRNSLSPFSSKIICGDCGSFYGSKVWHSTDKYRRVIWQCNNKFKNEKRCTTAHLNEESIKELFIKALGRLTKNRGELINTCEILTAELSDTAAIDAKIREHQAEMELTAELIKRLIAENANAPLNQVDFNREYDGLVERFTKATEKCEKLQRQKLRRLHQSDITSSFATEIKALPRLNIQCSDRLWLNLIDTATVYGDEKIVFRFKNGMEIEEDF
ncbi:MAG: recombinase family protein [Ruminococcus sp.]|nr:recombinase family protein [Ruminococcus sp.]